MDISDEDIWGDQLEELYKLPSFLRVRHTISNSLLIDGAPFITVIIGLVPLLLAFIKFRELVIAIVVCKHAYYVMYRTVGHLSREQPVVPYWAHCPGYEFSSALHESGRLQNSR